MTKDVQPQSASMGNDDAPDNWLRVPDFHSPSSMAEQFRGAIEGPHALHPELALRSRQIVVAARRLAQQSFASMNELRGVWCDYLDQVIEEDEFSPLMQATRATRDAVFYNMVIDLLEQTLLEKRRGIAEAFFLEAVGLFADWVADDGALPVPRRIQMKELSEKPRGSGKNLTAEVLAAFFAEHSGKQHSAVVLDAAEHFSTSVSTVNRRLKEAREKNLMS